MSGEAGYLKLLENVLYNGELRKDRTGTGTFSLFAPDPLRFDLSNSIPLFTTKKMGWKTVVKELLWFLRGDTDATILQEQGVRIWDGNTSPEFLKSRGLPYKAGVLGPGYGWQWRHFGAPYDEKYADSRVPIPDEYEKGYDQIAELEKTLKTDPFSRRIYLNAWNAKDLDAMALTPCHTSIQFYVSVDIQGKSYLSCHVYMRSNDLFLGNPFNVFSYAVLTYIFAKKCGMKPKELIISFGDSHIYLNHVEQVKEQITRTPYTFPKLHVSDTVRDKDWSEITIDDFTVTGYQSHPAIKGAMSA